MVMEIVCPAGTPAALRAAVKAGAHTVYCGFADETNARNFPGLNFSRDEMRQGVAFAHQHGSRVLIAINTYPRAGDEALWHAAIDDAARSGADAVILADPGLLQYAADNHPDMRRHLSVQAAAANADIIKFYQACFGIKRVVLPRVLSVPEIAQINAETTVETEVFVFGGLCVMAEGRCSLSSYVTGKSPNMHGVCSPPSHVEYHEEAGRLDARLGGFTIHRAGQGEPAPYPTLCKGCFRAGDKQEYLFEDPVSLNAEQLIPQLAKAGVTALKIEGRQRSRSYVAQVVRNFRAAVDALDAGQPMPRGMLARLAEGQASTTGAYKKTWR